MARRRYRPYRRLGRRRHRIPRRRIKRGRILSRDRLIGYTFTLLLILAVVFFLTSHRKEGDIENRIIELVNEERAKVGVHLLQRDSNLDYLAKTHSLKMREGHFLEHSMDNIGENVQETPIWYWTQGCGITITNNQVAECMFNAWKNSPGHYANMIGGSYTMTGVGVSCNIFECKGTQNFL